MMARAGKRDDLTFAQAVMLDAMRLSVIEMRRGVSMQPDIDERLGHLGAAGVARDLKRFMFALSQGCTRMIEVQCTCASGIGEDEQALLDVLSHAQGLSRVEALSILRGFVTEDGAQTALAAAEAIGETLIQAGCFVQAPDQSGSLNPPLDDLRFPHATLH